MTKSPPTVSLAEGWAIVPVEPTEAMLEAAQHAIINKHWLAEAYRKMLAASPAHTPAPDTRLPAHVFLDCDGVLADFDTYAEAYFGMPPRAYEKKVGSEKFWSELEAKGDFYRNLPLMPDARELFEGVKHLHPTILTGCPRGDWAQGQKVAWAAEHFPGVPIITCRSADKRDYAKPGDVLIDDWAQHRHRWIEMGGVFITHHDAKSSLAALWAHYPVLADGHTPPTPHPAVEVTEKRAREHVMPGDPAHLMQTALQWYLGYDFGYPHSTRESNIAVEAFKDGYRAAFAASASTTEDGV